MSQIADAVLGLHGLLALLVVFAFPALEASVFIGFVVPGEIAVVLGGVLAYHHRVALPAVIAAAILGAVIGDTVGYAVGGRYGQRLLDRLSPRLLRPDHVERGRAALHRHGGKAVFAGRFTASLRALVPGLSGLARLPYRTFLVYNVAGGAVWASGCVLAGYLAGDGWRRVESQLSHASLLLLSAVLAVGVGAAVVRRARCARRARDRARPASPARPDAAASGSPAAGP